MKAAVSSSSNVIDLSKPLGARPLSDADYRLMVDAVSDYAIFFLDVNGNVRSWNAGARRLKGYEADEVIGKHFSIFYPQELIDRRWPEHELEQAQREGRFEDEGWRLRKDGTRFWANIIITRLLGPEGELRGYAKITRDLTGRREQEVLLRQSEERFRLLVEGVQDYAIFMLDPSGHIISWNGGAEKNTGYKAAEVVGKHFSIFYPADLAATGAPAQELATALTAGKYLDEGWRLRKDGTRYWAGVVLTPVHDETGRHRGFAKVTRDLTDRRKLTELEDEGRRILTFLAMLGHELRNPLAPVANAISLMHLVEMESPTLVAARDVIERQVKQMTRLVDDLLDVSRITAGKIRIDRKPVHLQAVVTQAVESVGPAVRERGHDLEVKGNADVWISGDRGRLVQVLSNLLGNAAKFTPRGGHIGVDVQMQPGGQVELRVRDNGPGIAPHLLPNVFDLFVQGEQDASRSHGGLGLGLTLVRQLVALHGGDIQAYSKGVAGAGSEFVVRLPVMAAEPVDTPARAARGAGKILVVDDNRDSADTMALLLQSLGYSASVVYDGNAALASIATEAPDAVLLDLGLPGISGIEIAHKVKSEVVDPPQLIAVTGYGQESDREATFKAGFYGHLVKPVDFEQLNMLLKKLFA